MFKVKTFHNPISFYKGMTFNSGELHLTGIAEMSVFLDEKITKDAVKGVRICTYDHLMGKLFPKWYDPLTVMFLKSKIRTYLSQLGETFINIDECLDAFRFTVQLQLPKLQKGSQVSEEQIAFTHVFEKMMGDQEVLQYVNTLQYHSMKTRLSHIFKCEIKKIVIHQFKKIDALRMFFFHSCIRDGLEVLFYIPRDKDNELINHGWDRIYNKIEPDKQQWVKEGGYKAITKGHHFLQFIQGEKVDHSTAKSYETITFSNPVSFRSFLQENPPKKNDVQYVAPSHDDLNQMARDILQNIDKPFTHPSEKFLFYLYECKKIDNDIYLDFNTFVSCITSGWIQTSNKINHEW